MRNALAGNLSPSLTACNTRPRWQYTRWLISVYSLLALCFQARVWELVCWWPLGYWPPITILGDLSLDLSTAWSVGGNLVTDHRSPLLAIVPLTSLPPGPRVTLRVVHVVPCCWRHRPPMTDRITLKCLKCNIKISHFCTNDHHINTKQFTLYFQINRNNIRKQNEEKKKTRSWEICGKRSRSNYTSSWKGI